MISQTSNEFLSIRSWHRAVVGGKDMILRCSSALEHLQLFNGYMQEKRIEVYALHPGEYENISYRIVDSFAGIDYVRFGNVLCTSVNQTFNDMFDDYGNIDELALVEGLSGYYFSNGESFNGLFLKPEHYERFESIKEWAIEYYDEVYV